MRHVVIASILLAGCGGPRSGPDKPSRPESVETETVEKTDYTPPKDDGLLADDRLEDKKPAFDPDRADRRPVDGWAVNSSAAVIRLDMPIIKPDVEPELLTLHPSYAKALLAARGKGDVLPSVNLIDGKAKQFDDGLYAAIDQANYLGQGEALPGHVRLVRRMYDKAEKGSPASDYLAAGLLVAGEPIEPSPRAKAEGDKFVADTAASKPLGVYTWTKSLVDAFRFLRFFSRPIADAKVIEGLARVLRDDAALRDDYRKASSFSAGMTNPLVGKTPLDFLDVMPSADPPRVSLFPPSSSRETELFKRLFPMGLPPDADLMRELVTAIRSGKVNLTPRPDGGWYDHQVFALETLLLPEKGSESAHLLLTRPYKKRMLEAFQALVTKRRETHVRQLEVYPAAEATPVESLRLRPRLRVEPNPTYYLRTARSYAFLSRFLESSVGGPSLKSLHGLRKDGPRGMDLSAELRFMRDLFYGLHLLSAEDIGMRPDLSGGEVADRASCEKTASEWLSSFADDPDLAADTRVAVPVYTDPQVKTTRLWMTVGVRLARLDASYAVAPKVRPEAGGKPWEDAPPGSSRDLYALIAVDEFAEAEVSSSRIPDRDEFRSACDRGKTKAIILRAMTR